MKYEKNQYTEGFSICTLVIAGAFIAAGINSFLSGFPFLFAGFIWIGIGGAILAHQITALQNRKKLRNLVKNEFQNKPDVSIEEIHESTGISEKDIKAIILDLKAEGQLMGKFSSETGKMESAPVQTQSEEVKYCPNCGTALEKSNAAYCSYCGSKIE